MKNLRVEPPRVNLRFIGTIDVLEGSPSSSLVASLAIP